MLLEYFTAFAAVTLRSAGIHRGIRRMADTRTERRKRKVLRYLLRRANIRTYIRWYRKRQLKLCKWRSFRGWVDAIHTQRAAVRVHVTMPCVGSSM